MKFFLHKRKYILFILISVLFNIKTFSQKYELGIPKIISFTPEDYGYESQNYSVAQDSNRIIFIGNLNGIIIYDGHYWGNTKINGTPEIIYSKYDNKIYVGGYKSFGYLKNEYYNHYKFIDLLDSSINIGQITRIQQYKNYILFTDQYALYKYDIKKDSISLVKNANLFLDIFKCDTFIFVTDYKSLFSYNPYNDKMLLISKDFEDYILDIFPYSKDTFLIKTNWNFYYFIPKQKNKIESIVNNNVIKINNFLRKNKYSKTIKISNNIFVSGTHNCGLIFYDKNFSVLFALNEKNGISNDNISDMFLDDDNQLWIATSYGISHIEFPSPFTFYNYALGAKSFARDIIRYHNNIYFATQNGLFYISKNKKMHKGCFNTEIVNPVFNDMDFVLNQFLKLDTTLYISSETGLYKIEDSTYNLEKQGYYYTMYKTKFDTNIVLISPLNGVEKFRYKDNTLEMEGRFAFLDKTIRTIAEDSESIWFGSDYEGLYRIMLSDSLKNSSKVYDYTHAKGLPKNFSWIDVYTTSTGVLFSTEKGVLRYNSMSGTFYFDTTLGINFSSQKYWVYPIVEDKNKDIWFSMGITGQYRRHTFLAKYNHKTHKYKLNKSEFDPISNFTIEAIYPENNNLVWFSTPREIIRYDRRLKNKTKRKKLPILIHKIIIGKDSLLLLPIHYLSGKEEKIELDYKYHDIHIEVIVPTYNKNDIVYYQFFLKGYEKSPSAWKLENTKEYTNLPQGNYTLIVKARDSNNNLLGEIQLPFKINPPFYLTPFAYIYYAILLASLVFMIIYWRAYLSEKDQLVTQILLKERTKQLAYQKERVEQLLKKILPDDTARQISEKGKVERKSYKMVTVLFADIKGFTKIAENTPPEVLLDELDHLYLEFDKVVEELGIEKIKTIGDAYMCAGGIPKKNRTNPIEVVLAGIKMLQILNNINKTSKTGWEMRIGIHTGPVIAGILGTKRFTYDVWGDTVNVASRMESMGEPGKVNISQDTYELVHRFFDCEPRGDLPVKYKGKIKMYFVKGIKPELSIDGKGEEPNKQFWLNLQMIRFFDLEEYMLNKLEKGLPANLYYHNLRHTIDVMNQVELIAREEGCSNEEILLLKTAALFHDSGLMETSYHDHEEQSIKIAKEILPRFKYTPVQIQRIAELIYATKLPPNPKNKLEQIMCDADLDYLGREDFLPISNLLFKELYEQHIVKNKKEWDEMQIKFLENHQYFTEAARRHRRVNKLKQLEKLRKELETQKEKNKKNNKS